MSSTTRKHSLFVFEPMGNKSVQHIPGIGYAIGRRLADRGLPYAYQLYGQYLLLQRSKTKFIIWLIGLGVGANRMHAENAYACLNEYNSLYL